jgi:hypothetical protein
MVGATSGGGTSLQGRCPLESLPVASDVVMDARGRVFLLHPTAEYLIADSIDAAVTAPVRTTELRMVDDHGGLVESDRGRRSDGL